MKNSTIKPKEKTCVECGTKFMPSNSLEKTCPKYDCRCSFALKIHAKQKAVKEKKSRIETKVQREKIKTLSEWKKDLQIEINRIVQVIDKNWPCIATGATTGKRNSGHYISIGSNDTIRFHLENIWNQSEHSNTWKSGDTLRYQDGIVHLYGQEYLNRLNRLKMIHPVKLSIDDLKEKIKIARKILMELKSLDKTYSLAERIELRVKYNLELGIYDTKYCVFEK